MKVSQSHEIIGSRAIVIQIECLLALFDCLPAFSGQQIGIREIQMSVDAFGRQINCLEIEGNGIRGIFSFEIAVASAHKMRELISLGPPTPKKPEAYSCQTKRAENPNETLLLQHHFTGMT